MATFVNFCSAFKKTETVVENNVSIEKPLYLNTTVCQKKFWSNEPIGAGIAIVLTERKAGEKYTKVDGTTGVVKRDGWNFDGIVGNANVIKGVKDTADALKEAGF